MNCIVDICSEESKNKFLIAYSVIMKSLEGRNKRTESIIQSEIVKNFIEKYGSRKSLPLEEIANIEIKASEIEMKHYFSIFSDNSSIFFKI